MNAYITTCDHTSHILPAAICQLRKYWNLPANITFIGYSRPDIEMYDYRFVSMAPRQESINDWARDIYSIIKDDPNDLVILSVDDALVTDYGDRHIFDRYLDLFNNPETVRAALGCYLQKYPHQVIEKGSDFEIIRIEKTCKYRLVCGWSIWRKDHLLKYLAQSTTPWHFETAHPAPEGNVIGSKKRYAVTYQIEGAVSSGRIGDNINILGIKTQDVIRLVRKGHLNPQKLIYGNYIQRQKRIDRPALRYLQTGAHFRVKYLEPLLDEKTYLLYKQAYEKIYENTGNW